jgi:hypothetical protein
MQRLISIDENSHNIGEEFKAFLDKQTEIINNLISSNLNNYIYTTNIIQTKIDIYNFLQNKIILILTEYNKSNNYQRKDNSKKATILFKILVEINALIKEKELSLYKIIGILHSKENNNKNNDQYIGSSFENENLIKENYHLKAELTEKNKKIKVLENMNNILNEKLEKINLENEALTTKILERSKKCLNDSTIKSGFETIMKNKNDTNNIYLNKDNNNFTINTRINLPNMPKNSFNKQIIVSKKKLTREQLNEIIQNIYKSKIAYDQNCIDLNKPLETMEQHMYQYLNNKYGLKNLTIEYASAIISGIKEFSKKDMNIKLFGMLLKNEIEENTLTIVDKIKQVIQETLEYFISQKNPYMVGSDIQKICEDIKKGMVDEVVWNSFVDTLFLNDKENGKKVKDKIYEFIDRIMKNGLEKLGNNLKFEMTREEEDFYKELQQYPKKIRYEDLINIFIDYHIKVRKNYLKNMRELFMNNDENKDGVLTKKEFIKYISDLKIFHEETLEENIDYLLRKIPQCEKYDFFSFSEVVELFDQEQILKENNEKCSILDFLAK